MRRPIGAARAAVSVLATSAMCLGSACAPGENGAQSAEPGAVETAAAREPIEGPQVAVTTLTTNGADVIPGVTMPLQGEWSFAAWVEVDGRPFLFDTGYSPGNVLHNAEALGIDLSAAEDLILSHNHPDHTGGLETLRVELSKRNPSALSRIHVAAGIFAPRPRPGGVEGNPMIAARQRLEALGSTFIVYTEPTEIAPGVWVTGPVPRVHDETNYPVHPGYVMLDDGEPVPDVVPDSQSLVVLAAGGPIFVSGCGHAGLINTLDFGRDAISDQQPQAAIGGFHLYDASDETLRWTAEKLAEARLGNFIGSHCTGFETVLRIRDLAGMSREQAAIGAIGTRYETETGIVRGNINR